NRPVALRMNTGLVVFQASAITLPGGKRAILLASSVTEELREDVRSSRVISGIEDTGQYAALVDGEGNIAAASKGFDSLKLTPSKLGDLLDDVREGSVRLAKRHIHSDHASLAAGIARLTDETPLFLLLIVSDVPAESAPERPAIAPASATVREPNT